MVMVVVVAWSRSCRGCGVVVAWSCRGRVAVTVVSCGVLIVAGHVMVVSQSQSCLGRVMVVLWPWRGRGNRHSMIVVVAKGGRCRHRGIGSAVVVASRSHGDAVVVVSKPSSS